MLNSNLKTLFKPYLVQDEVDKSADREVMNTLYDKLLNKSWKQTVQLA